MTREQVARLVHAGLELRKAQKRHDRTHKYDDNRCRLEAEKKFDEVLEECAKGAPQPSLFNLNQ